MAVEHPALARQLPAPPIPPGLILPDEMVRAVGQERAQDARGWRIGAAKFLKPVRPGETLTLEHDALPNGSITFRISSAGQPVAHGILLPGKRAARAAP